MGKQDPLEYLGDVRAEGVAEGSRVDIALGKLGGAVLGREQNVDPFVDSVIGDEIVDETIASLGDPVDAVLCLEVVVETETPVEKNRVVRDSQRKSFFCRTRGRD